MTNVVLRILLLFIILLCSRIIGMEVGSFVDSDRYIEKFQKGDWEQKTEIVYLIAKTLEIRKDENLRINLEKMSVLLSRYASHLKTKDLKHLLYGLNAVYHRETLCPFVNSTRLNIRRILRIENSESDSSIECDTNKLESTEFPRQEITYKLVEKIKLYDEKKKKNRSYKINMPINKGLGEFAIYLEKCLPFSGEVTLLLSRIAHVKVLNKNETLFRQGSVEDSIYIILNGKIAVFVENEDGFSHHVDTLTNGQTVGEMSIFTEKGRTATVTAIETSKLLQIGRDSFKQLAKSEPTFLRDRFYQLVIRADRGRTKIQESCNEIPENRLIRNESVSHTQLTLFARKMKEREYPKKYEVVHESTSATSLYYLVEGRCSRFKGDKKVGVLSAGEYYDEFSFFSEKGCCPHSLVTDGECTFWSISRLEFESLGNDILWELAGELCNIINQNNSILKMTDSYKLQQACENDHFMEATRAISRGAKIDVPCPLEPLMPGAKPIHVAAKYGSFYVLTVLTAFGVDINGLDDLGNTAVHFAAQTGRVEILKHLHMHGALLNQRNIHNETPVEIAHQSNNRDIEKYLLSQGISCKECNSVDKILQ